MTQYCAWRCSQVCLSAPLCRKRYPADILRSGHSPLGAVSLLRILFGYAVGDGREEIARGANVSSNTVTSVFQRLDAVLV